MINKNENNLSDILSKKDIYLDIQNQQKTGITKNINPYKSKLTEEQIINTSQLVDLFGSPTNKKTYKKNKKIANSTRDSLIKKASQYCIIEPLGDGQFKIKKILDFSLNKKIVKFLNSPVDNLFKTILLKVVTYAILSQSNENNGLSFRLMKYARDFSLINENYQILKYSDNINKQNMLDTINVSEVSMMDFYNSVDNSINDALLDILNVLADVHAISLTKNMLILIKKDEHGNFFKKRASEKEEGIITKAIDNFIITHDIQNYNDLFYGQYIKPKFEAYMNKILDSIHCVHFYRTYEVFITNSKLLKHILTYTDFKVEDLPIYYATLNTLFITKMNKNASSRKDKRILKAIRSSDPICEFLQKNNINSDDLTLSNYKEIIPQELIDEVINQLTEISIQKNKERDFSKLSTTMVDIDEFSILCDTNIKPNPYIKLFQLCIDNSVEGKSLMAVDDEQVPNEFKSINGEIVSNLIE